MQNGKCKLPNIHMLGTNWLILSVRSFSQKSNFAKSIFGLHMRWVHAVCVLSRQQLNFVCFTCSGQMRRQKSDPFEKMDKNVQFSMSAKKAILGLRWARAVCALSRPNLDSVCCCCCCSGLGLGMLGLRMRRTHQKSQVDPATQFGRGTPPGHNTILRLGSLEKKSIFL